MQYLFSHLQRRVTIFAKWKESPGLGWDRLSKCDWNSHWKQKAFACYNHFEGEKLKGIFFLNIQPPSYFSTSLNGNLKNELSVAINKLTNKCNPGQIYTCQHQCYISFKTSYFFSKSHSHQLASFNWPLKMHGSVWREDLLNRNSLLCRNIRSQN